MGGGCKREGGLWEVWIEEKENYMYVYMYM